MYTCCPQASSARAQFNLRVALRVWCVLGVAITWLVGWDTLSRALAPGRVADAGDGLLFAQVTLI